MKKIDKKLITVHREVLTHKDLEVEAFIILPSEENFKPCFTLFTHGYTSHKGAILSWGKRMADAGIPSILFDLPGHYLGSFRELSSFESFTLHTHKLFSDAYQALNEKVLNFYEMDESDLGPYKIKLVLGGHSMGALMAIKALSLPQFSAFERMGVFVGFGMNRENDHAVHALEMPFYRPTLEFREELISPHLHSSNVFPWLKKEKKNLKLKGLPLHFITGEDDIIARPEEMQKLIEDLKNQGNEVTYNIPRKLSHHTPEAAAPHIYGYLKNFIR